MLALIFVGGGGGGPVIPPVVSEPSGPSLYVRAEQERYRRKAEKRDRDLAKKKAKKIKDKINRELALAERAIEEGIARREELARMSRLAYEFQQSILDTGNPQFIMAMEEALSRQTFSTLERLEREIFKAYEEQQFFEMAVEIILNQ